MTWRTPPPIRNGERCPFGPHRGAALAVRLHIATGLEVAVRGDHAVSGDLTLVRQDGYWSARWQPSWDVAGWAGSGATVGAALEALAHSLRRPPPGRTRAVDAMRRKLLDAVRRYDSDDWHEPAPGG